MNYTNVFCAVIALLFALVDAFLLPWLKTKMDASQLEQLIKMVQIAVEAAEQIYGSSKGTEKKQYVLDYLKNQGITYNEETVNNLIESSVIEMNKTLLDK